MEQDRLAHLEAEVAELKAYIARLEAERDEVVGELRAALAVLEADLDEHLESCPGKSKVNQRRAKKKAGAEQPSGQAEGA